MQRDTYTYLNRYGKIRTTTFSGKYVNEVKGQSIGIYLMLLDNGDLITNEMVLSKSWESTYLSFPDPLECDLVHLYCLGDKKVPRGFHPEEYFKYKDYVQGNPSLEKIYKRATESIKEFYDPVIERAIAEFNHFGFEIRGVTIPSRLHEAYSGRKAAGIKILGFKDEPMIIAKNDLRYPIMKFFQEAMFIAPKEPMNLVEISQDAKAEDAKTLKKVREEKGNNRHIKRQMV